MNKQMNAILALINPDNTISINRPLAHAIGLHETIIYESLISKYIYYKEREMIEDDWFFCTENDLKESTTLGVKPQRTAIENLRKHGLIKVVKKGVPARRYFYICQEVELLEQLIEEGITKDKSARKETEAVKERKFEEKTAEKPSVYASWSQKAQLDGPDGNNQMNPKSTTSWFQKAQLDGPDRNNQMVPMDTTSSSQTEHKTKYQENKKEKPNQSNLYSELAGWNERFDRAFEVGDYNTIYEMIIRRDPTLSKDKIKLKEDIAKNIELKTFIANCVYAEQKEQIDYMISIFDVICSVILNPRENIKINGVEVSWMEVVMQFMRLNYDDVCAIIDRLGNEKLEVKSMVPYLISCLFNEALGGDLKVVSNLSI